MDFRIGILKGTLRTPKTQLRADLWVGSRGGSDFNSSTEFDNNLPPNDHISPFISGPPV